MNDTLTHLSLFSGIGGFDLAAEWAGIRTIAQCESDPYCCKVLEKHWPDVPRFHDIRELHAEDIPEPVDIISGGFPCQDVSNAGTTHEGGLKGLDGTRSGLWSEMARLIGELQPRWVVVENVAALAVRGLGTVLHNLATLGFDAEWSVIQARDVGAPHIRKRLFVLANRRIRYAHEMCVCPCGCDEPWCNECGEHYAECCHPGPTDWEEALSDPDGTRLEGDERSILAESQQWRYDANAPRPDWGNPTPRLRGDHHGVPCWMDRLRVLGNAVVPQVVYPIFRAIREREEATRVGD